jgi:hypothetical protein
MQKQKQLQYAVIGVLGFALLFMTVGFAAYAQIAGASNASAISTVAPIHNVGFDADSYLESDTSKAAISKTIVNNNIDFQIKLDKPGDSYAALVNIENNGNVDESVDEIVMSEVPQQYADAIEYKIEYDDEYYIGTSYDVDSVIGRGGANRKQLFITVNYKNDAKNLGPIELILSAGIKFAE